MTKQEWQQVIVFCRTMSMAINYAETNRIPPEYSAHDPFSQWAKTIVPTLQYIMEMAEIHVEKESENAP